MTAVQDYVENPRLFLHRINFSTGRFEFIDIERANIAANTFLDDQSLAACPRQPGISFDDLSNQLKEHKACLAPADKFIFHIGFCCSTLVSRALEHPGAVLSLREPNIFHNLADFKRWPKTGPPTRPMTRPVTRPMTGPVAKINFDEALDIGLRLLNRPFEDTETIVVKPANITNNLIMDIMGKNPSTKAVFLYVPLKSFLISILKKGEAGRAFSRKLFMKYRLDEAFRQSVFFKTPFMLTDLQVVVFLWIMQMQLFQQCLESTQARRIFILNGEHFLENPSHHLTRMAAFFDLPLDKEHFDSVVEGPVFQTDSKRPGRAFSSMERIRENRQTYNNHARAFDEILKWAYPYLQSAGISSAFTKET